MVLMQAITSASSGLSQVKVYTSLVKKVSENCSASAFNFCNFHFLDDIMVFQSNESLIKLQQPDIQ